LREVIRVRGEQYILATSPLADGRTRVLKHDDTFGVFDRYGDIHPIGMGEQGIFHHGTRFLSRLSLALGSVRPLLLSSTVREDNTLFTADLTNPDDYIAGMKQPKRMLCIYRGLNSSGNQPVTNA